MGGYIPLMMTMGSYMPLSDESGRLYSINNENRKIRLEKWKVTSHW